MKVFLTGGTGFIGSYIVMELLNKGHEVTLLARNPEKIPKFNEFDKVRLINADFKDYETVALNLQGHDVCIHNALLWGNNGLEMLRNDTLSSVFLFETAAAVGIKQFIYTSSTAAIGEFRPNMNEETKTKPVDYYGATKAASEDYLLAASASYSMCCNIIRPGYTFGNPVVEGAPMEVDSRFRKIVDKAIAGEDIELIQYDGTQFIWAGDLAKIYSAVIEAPKNREIYFGLGLTYVSWEQIAQEAIKLTDSKSRILLSDKGYGNEPYLFDVTKIQSEFGFSFNSQEMIVDHLRYLIAHHND